MTKKLILVTALALLVAGCSGEKAENTAETAAAAPTVVSIVDFNAHAADYVDQTITVTGTVDHVCKHSGKKMFIMGDDPAHRLKIETSDKVPTFDIALEGSKVSVTGIGRVFKMDAAYLDNWEAETCAAEAKSIAGTGKDHEGETAEDQANEAQSKIDNMRKQLAETGEEFVGFYHLEAVSFEELH
ncbi:MAG: hypothetical protein GY838_15115 [bacterium]|nr:hypothetical protein [bacterium]